jgi:hypothetical protein
LEAARLEAARIPESSERDLVNSHLDRAERHLAAVAARDDGALTDWALANAGLPSRSTLDEAHRILERSTADERAPETLTSEHVADAMRAAIADVGADGWTVQIFDQMAAQCSVNGPRRRLRVRTGLAVSGAKLRRLVVHEVGGHVLRWENSRRQAEELLSIPLGETVATEEGLAALLESRLGLLTEDQLRVYAARVVAVDSASSQGIVRVARDLLNVVGEEDAVEIAVRVKRGLIDPNRPGGPTKDHGYLSGLRLLWALPASDLGLLRAVKWPLEALPVLRELKVAGRLAPAHYDDEEAAGRWLSFL